jgi:hypothetical protein
MMMNKNEFDLLIEIKIRELISLTLDKEQLSFESALQYLYESKLYASLIDETTKLWHLSTVKLFEMLQAEKRSKKLILPDYV